MEELAPTLLTHWETFLGWLTSGAFYLQIIMILVGAPLAAGLAGVARSRTRFLERTPETGAFIEARQALNKARGLLFPLCLVVLLGAAGEISAYSVSQKWLIRIAQGLAVIWLVYRFVVLFVRSRPVVTAVNWLGVPIAVLYVLGWLDDVSRYLDGVSLAVGNIHLSVYDVVRTLIFGALLFWLGRISNSTGKKVIRQQQDLDVGTREVMAKLFEITLFVVIFLLLLQVMGINLTTLAVFGGALGVGLGFGLQQIASNFISGIIILLDRSIAIDDFIELEDGRSGRIRELTMRSATLETFDGKDIMVPNETFITSTFTNWTHHNKKQRYSLDFSVAYKTDLPKLFDIVRKVVASHPKVLSGENIPAAERPDAEIASFGDSGINILVEFWMDGIDDGENRVGADLLLMIWMALNENGIEIPFPQREVSILSPQTASPLEKR